MTKLHSFPPLSKPNAAILILGSMPGKASLQAGEYYAHPRNAFWPIMQSLLGLNPDLGYAEKCAALARHRIAVWDVLRSCTRTSSLDSDIVESSIVPNDFERFLLEHGQIQAVYFNGAKAESSYLRYVQPNLLAPLSTLARQRLPSTSPAHASLSFDEKLKKWQVITSPLGPSSASPSPIQRSGSR